MRTTRRDVLTGIGAAGLAACDGLGVGTDGQSGRSASFGDPPPPPPAPPPPPPAPPPQTGGAPDFVVNPPADLQSSAYARSDLLGSTPNQTTLANFSP
ncbi:MAG: hypothetical protein AAFR11_14065, partial [Pseudomonadota bacterium]